MCQNDEMGFCHDISISTLFHKSSSDLIAMIAYNGWTHERTPRVGRCYPWWWEDTMKLPLFPSNFEWFLVIKM